MSRRALPMAPSPALGPDVLAAFVKPGPRYTSYPPATRFTDEVDAAVASAELAALPRAPVSLYAHIPFCSSLCWYCGCNVVATRNRDRGTEYVDLLERELALLGARTGRLPVAELALGGGSPNFLAPADLARLAVAVDRHFDRTDDALFGVELDPRDTPLATVDVLAAAGFTRLSVGIQDFSEEVQRRINRHQSAEQTAALIAHARAVGFRSANGDLVYGLPGQTEDSFADTLAAVVSMRPDQIALFGYAHLPDRLPHQKLVERDGPVPGTELRARLLAIALEAFAAAGYVPIGLDHFALPDSPLARAADEGALHRNFQGYVVKQADALLAVGATGISDSGTAYWQNLGLDAWRAAVSEDRLPVRRGVRLTADDRVRRHMIMTLMCYGALDMAEVDAGFGLRFEDAFADELARLETGDEARLAVVDRDARRIEATELGRHLIRNVCMVFDPGLRGPGGDQARFSTTL